MGTGEGPGPARGSEESPAPGGSGPVRPHGAPGIGSIFVLAFLVILFPGVAGYVVLDWIGLPIGAAGLLGLFVVFLGLGFFPTVLRRLGWVPTKRRRT
ncbi:hypothetical protein CcI156_00765 [Frankia sp. CcI156]|uniref:Uncharacterized protein n=1 Tax=Frankia casuarinae (strain DSM 45818 / CECT 9043 / HFP020203 / CcI3) TaxID=106370 RepID=Q2JFN8_FRACC|nr:MULTISPECIES: hypothetical protein [Frankia]ABD09904.1 hypothetical protein Francci3_0520 [Frankia casuarinae]ETA04387.1 hypothetical protein CcI6DRAFT_00161 [Frankia sp. CcI6]EYT90211.1 hypothetical protein ThrDRAFT_04159 [Frankia casuarinae]KDA44915.1 hypothetical protein BMG523Draft_00039 [Frankia sp. BMG5.23]KEZ38113.1 hypothetical protein CEDDRAFT_00440 [Frankia sp. CeD]